MALCYRLFPYYNTSSAKNLPANKKSCLKSPPKLYMQKGTLLLKHSFQIPSALSTIL